MTDDSVDATIGAPTADATGESTTVDPDVPTLASVFVADGTEWEELRVAAGETIEVTLPNGQPIAYVAVDADAIADAAVADAAADAGDDTGDDAGEPPRTDPDD